MREIGVRTADERPTLMEPGWDGLAQHRLAGRAHALILFDRGMSCRQAATVLPIDDDAVGQWRLIFGTEDVEGPAGFHFGRRQAFLAHGQRAELAAWITATPPRTAREVGAFMHAHDSPLNHPPHDETVMFADAVHPVHGAHGARPAGCRPPPDVAPAVARTAGRGHLNFQGAADLESGQRQMPPVGRADAQGTLAMPGAIERRFPARRRVHVSVVLVVLVGNARRQRAKPVQNRRRQPGRRISPRFIPPCCPHLTPMERLRGVMHKAITHNRCSANPRAFQKAVLTFPRRTVPQTWPNSRDDITDNVRVRDPAMCRTIK